VHPSAKATKQARDPRYDFATETIPVSLPAEDSIDHVPLVVDLDGTLIATDTLLEGALRVLKQEPRSLLQLGTWLVQGKAVLKAAVAHHSPLNAETLPYRPAVLEFLQAQRLQGRKIVLATAAHQSTAYAVAVHLGLFDEVIASTDTDNLKGRRKRDALIQRFGIRGFDYIGDARADIPVWSVCRTAYAAGHMSSVPRAALVDGSKQGGSFATPRANLRTWVRLMRVYQWVKNLLVFIPAFLNHSIDLTSLKSVLVTFFAFSFVASGTYIFNDLFDLESDRKHPRKCKRPLAAGEISITQGVVMAHLLLLGGLLMGASIGLVLVLCLLTYFALTSLYSAFLKRKPVLDVITLAMLYTVRVYSGGLVSGAYVSPWLFQFSIFFFLSLAFVKRYSELRRLRYQRQFDAPGRGYRLGDLSIISQAGIGSGMIAGLVLALYINAQELQRTYPHPHMLWGVCPLFIYWIVRVWLVAHRGNMQEDPILFAFHDRVSYIVGSLIVAAVILGLTPYAS